MEQIVNILASSKKKYQDLASFVGKDDFEQFLVRFIVSIVVIVYASVGEHGHEVSLFGLTVSLGQIYAFSYFSSLLLTSSIFLHFDINRQFFRYALMAIDIVFLTSTIWAMPEPASPLFFIYLLIILGFGFRFGNKYLFAAMAMSLVGFTALLTFNEFWQKNRMFGLGYLFALLIVSVYVSLFIRRLNIAKAKMLAAVTRADAANEAKSKFLANMSHELRTPLNGVITVSELLSETDLDKSQKELTETIQSSSRTLLELINDVLDFSKIESEKIILDNICFDLYACVADVVRIVRPMADNKNISVYNNIASNTPRYVYGDPVRLKQVLINLANNAVKFTEKGHISIHVYSTETESNFSQINFDIIDTGIGIAPEAQTKIFDRFVQEDDSTTRKFGGTGLGISIAKQLVELMGGNIGVSSNKGKGSRFYFDVSLIVASTEEYESLEADILIVSESADLFSEYRKLLESWDYSCVLRKSIDSAMDMLEIWKHSKRNCVIIIDEEALHMPPVRAAQLIKSTGVKTMNLMLSTSNPVHIKNDGVQSYFNHIFDRPADSRQLYNALMGKNTYTKDGVVALSSHFESHSQHKPKLLTILVAEDQLTNQFVFKKILQSQGHKVTVVDDGQQALDVLAVEKFDVCIVDLNMPNLSGIETIKMFRYMEPDSEMPFIVVTANTSEEIISECNLLAKNVLIKPIEKQQLIDAVYGSVTTSSEYAGHDKSEFDKFDELPLMDFESLDGMIGEECDAEFMSELFTIFGNDAGRLVDDVDIYLKNKNTLYKAKQSFHALKGIANNVSAIQLATIAKYCEDEIQANPDISRDTVMICSRLKKSLHDTKDAMKAFIAQNNLNVVD